MLQTFRSAPAPVDGGHTVRLGCPSTNSQVCDPAAQERSVVRGTGQEHRVPGLSRVGTALPPSVGVIVRPRVFSATFQGVNVSRWSGL